MAHSSRPKKKATPAHGETPNSGTTRSACPPSTPTSGYPISAKAMNTPPSPEDRSHCGRITRSRRTIPATASSTACTVNTAAHTPDRPMPGFSQAK